ADAVETLIFALKDKKMEVRCAAAKALGKFRNPKTVEPLMQMLRDPAVEARVLAAEILGQLGDQRAVNDLVNSLRDEDTTVRTRASRSLERLGWEPENDTDRVLKVTATGNMNDLAGLGPSAIQPLTEILRTGPPDKQLSAIKALAQIEDILAVPPLREALKNPDPFMRLTVLGALERIGDPSAYDDIERLLTDRNSNVRVAAIEAAIHCGGGRAVMALIKCLKDSVWEVRHAAIRGLGTLAEPTAVDALCEMLKDGDRDVRESAVTALGRIGDRSAIQHLVLALIDPESSVRSTAANSLQEIDRHWEKNAAAREVVPKLKAALEHNEYWVRHSANKVLERMNIATNGDIGKESNSDEDGSADLPQAIFVILKDLIRDHDRDFRLAAAEALERLQAKSARPLLVTAETDGDLFVRQTVQRALAALN
ncbi:MAG: HEAT repeat domain-containing protein, partial [Limisphaerales bacterium]